MDLIAEGLKQKLICFEDGGKYIVYLPQEKRRNYENPEEKVQAETFLKLVLIYKYPAKRVRQFVPVQMGSDTKEADIIVYADDELKAPLIIGECKKPDVSELEFARATDQAVSYANPELAKYVWVTSRIKNEYFEIPAKKPKARIPIPDVPQFGVDELAKFKFAKGGGQTKNGQKLFELEKVSEDELTRRFQQAHQALWGGGELNPSEAFDELDKLIFCKIWDERKARKAGEPYDFQIFNDETADDLLNRLKNLYAEGRKKDPEVFKDDIRLSAVKARTVVKYLEAVNLSETDLDSKGRAFETFMGSFFRGDFGQYFTPRVIVKFIVDVLPITHESLVLDTSCGSGGFLLHALDKVRREADEFFPKQKGPPEGKDHFNHWHEFAEHNLYGIEINEQIARTAKMNMIIHDDGHTNVVANDGLLPADEIRAKANNQGFKEARFDFIITNPPFGSVVRLTEQAYMNQYRFATRETDWLNPKSLAAQRPNQDTEILFIEQCHKYLVEGGCLAIVIPDGILTNSSLQYVRDGIEDFFRIIAVVSLPGTAFAATGAGVKSSVLFLKKNSKEQTRKIQDTKQALKDAIRKEQKFSAKLDALENEKKKILKEQTGLDNPAGLTGKELKESEAYKKWSKAVSEKFTEQIEDLRYRLTEIYDTKRRKALDDYNIFMAIAEDIGYDATGRATKTNELDPISDELRRFITAVEEGKELRFLLSKSVNPPTTFFASLSEFSDRFDPEMVLFRRETHTFKYPVRRLSELFREPPQYGAGERGLDRESNDQPRYVRITDIDEDGLLTQELGATAATIESRYILEDGDLLFARSGNTVGKTYLHKTANAAYPCFFAGYLIRLRFDTSRILPDYIFALTQLPYYKKWVAAVQRTAGQPNINAQEYSNLQLPCPSLAVQEKIVQHLEKARAAAEALRRQAAAELSAAKKEIEAMILGGA